MVAIHSLLWLLGGTFPFLGFCWYFLTGFCPGRSGLQWMLCVWVICFLRVWELSVGSHLPALLAHNYGCAGVTACDSVGVICAVLVPLFELFSVGFLTCRQLSGQLLFHTSCQKKPFPTRGLRRGATVLCPLSQLLPVLPIFSLCQKSILMARTAGKRQAHWQSTAYTTGFRTIIL